MSLVILLTTHIINAHTIIAPDDFNVQNDVNIGGDLRVDGQLFGDGSMLSGIIPGTNYWARTGTTLTTTTAGDDIDLDGFLTVDTDVLVANLTGYTGKVGINTVTPAVELDVVGRIKATSSSYPVLGFTRETTTNGNGTFDDTTGIASAMRLITKTTAVGVDGFGGGIVICGQDSDDASPNGLVRLYGRRDGGDDYGCAQIFTGNNAEDVAQTWRASGKIGMGVTDPDSKLEIKSTDSSGNYALTVRDSDDTALLRVADNGVVSIDNYLESSRLVIDTDTLSVNNNHEDHKVGINTVTPAVELDVVGRIKATSSSFPVLGFTRETSVTSGRLDTLSGLASAMQLITYTSGNMADGFGGGIVISGQESGGTAKGWGRLYARRDGGDQEGAVQIWGGYNGTDVLQTWRSDGRVGIGTTEPNAKLHVKGDLFVGERAIFSQGIVTNEDGGSTSIHDTRFESDNYNNAFILDASSDEIRTNVIMKLGNGSGSNYTEIKADGEINLHGTARTKKCVYIGANGIKAPSSNPATFVEDGLTGCWEFADTDVEANQEQVSGTLKVPCGMDITVAPTFNLGWHTDTASTGNAKWQFEYLWRSADEDVTAVAQETLTVISSASATANGLVVATITGIDLPSSTDKTMFWRITRLSADASDTVEEDIHLRGQFFEYTANKLGEAI